MMPAEVLEFIQSGARGTICKRARLVDIQACLNEVAAGQIWMESGDGKGLPGTRAIWSALTKREQQVLGLLKDGLPNQQIASELQISQAHLKDSFKEFTS